MALRPRLSTGLLLSDVDKRYYSKRLQNFTLHFSHIGLQECNEAQKVNKYTRKQVNTCVRVYLSMAYTCATLAHDTTNE